VLHHGRLIEAGTHDELIAAGHRYAELFTLQAAGYDTTPTTPGQLPRQPAGAP
jgi:ATP-binding cassette subfamily B protein